jgi:hypothetical protein
MEAVVDTYLNTRPQVVEVRVRATNELHLEILFILADLRGTEHQRAVRVVAAFDREHVWHGMRGVVRDELHAVAR